MAKTPTPAPTAAQPAPLDINALLANVPAGGGTTSLIGLPAGTTSPAEVLAQDKAAQAAWGQGQPAAAYANGAQYLPVIQSWAPDDIDNLQRRLITAGLLDKNYSKGVWDQPSQQAFTEVLGLANNMGKPWQDALTQYENATPMTWNSKTGQFEKLPPGTSRSRTPLVTRYTSPDDLATTAQGVATAKLGRSFSPDELRRFITAYHGTEAAASQQAYTAGGAGEVGGPGGGVTAASSPDVAADVFARQADPNAYNAEQFLPLVTKMNQLLSGTAAPTTTKPMSA